MKTLSRDSGRCRTFRVGSVEVPYELSRRRVRYPRLEFKTGKLVVVLPRNVKDEMPLLERRASWIVEKFTQIEQSIRRIADEVKPDGLIIFGKVYHADRNGKVRVETGHASVEFNLDEKKKMMRILRKLLRTEINRLVQEYSKKFNAKPNKVFVRTQKTKWASCSTKGNLSFNLKLVHLPPRLVRYVVCHEVLHLREKKHTKTFWEFVKREFKNFKQLEKDLLDYWFFVQRYSDSLMRST